VAAESATLNFILNLPAGEFWLSGTPFVDVSKDVPADSLAGDGADARARREPRNNRPHNNRLQKSSNERNSTHSQPPI